MAEKLKLLQLPNEVLDKILLNLSYDEIAKNRVVCKKFNVACGELLTRGFLNIERRHSTILKKVKSMLPRRESERRVHDLARHSDILTAIETRISMLRMTFMKYIDLDACYFIPGKVIDEITRILLLVEGTTPPPRTHEVLQELRDISSMAMEHFDENIAPDYKLQRPNPFQTIIPHTHPVFYPPTSVVKKDTTRKDVSLLQHRTLHQRLHIKLLEKTVSRLLIKVKKQNTVIRGQFTKIKEQSLKIKNQDASIADLTRHVDEWDLKFADLVAELSRARDETSSTNSGPTATITQPPSPISPATACRPASSMLISPSRQFKTNIKPRVAQALPRSVSCNEQPPQEPERKRKLGVTSSSYAPTPMKISRVQSMDDDTDDIKSLLRFHNENYSKITPFMSSSLETLVNSPITSIQSRKRKSQ